MGILTLQLQRYVLMIFGISDDDSSMCICYPDTALPSPPKYLKSGSLHSLYSLHPIRVHIWVQVSAWQC